jgi:hypothetical protein
MIALIFRRRPGGESGIPNMIVLSAATRATGQALGSLSRLIPYDAMALSYLDRYLDRAL